MKYINLRARTKALGSLTANCKTIDVSCQCPNTKRSYLPLGVKEALSCRVILELPFWYLTGPRVSLEPKLTSLLA